ncbi:hypothetical protein H8356DRAFT_1428139 [Neocallimastix lanati (nom. inval.)]|nr:hypothetical protein H8356DRAFT_1428139 [Neocallimastix sp. JGI-2020a]
MNHNISFVHFRSSTIVGIVGVKIIDVRISLTIFIFCVKRKRFLLILTILLENNDIRSRGYKDIKIILNSQSKTDRGFKDKITIYQEYLTDGL